MEDNNKLLQNAIVKLWELIRNTGENNKAVNELLDEVNSQNKLLETALKARESELFDTKSKYSSLQMQFDEILNLNNSLNESIALQNIKLEKLDELNTKSINDNKLIEDLEQKLSLSREKAAFVPILTDEIEQLKLRNLELENVYSELQFKSDELNRANADLSFAQQEIVRRNHDIINKNNELKKLKEDYADAQNIIFGLRKLEIELNDKDLEIESYKNQILDLESKFNDERIRFEEEKVRLLAKKSTLEEELNENKYIISAHEQTISELLAKTLGAQADKAEISEALNNLRADNSQNEQKIDALTEEIIILNDTITEFELIKSELNRLKSDYDLAQSDLEIVSNQKYDLEKKISFIETELSEKNKLLKEAQLYQDELIENVENTNLRTSEFESKIKELNDEISKLNNELISKNNSLLENQGKLAIMESKLNIQMLENTELSDEIEKYSILKNKFEILEDEFAQIESENEQLKKQISDFESLKSDYEKSLNHTKEENISLNSSINELSAEIAKLNDENEKLVLIEQENVNLVQELKHYKSQFESTQKQISEKSDTIERLRQSVENLKSDNDKLYEELEKQISASDKVNDYSAKLNEYELQIAEYKNLISNLENETKVQSQEYIQVNEKLSRLEAERNSFEENCIELNNQLTKLAESNDNLQVEIQTILKDKNTLETNSISIQDFYEMDEKYKDSLSNLESINKRYSEIEIIAEERLEEIKNQREQLVEYSALIAELKSDSAKQDSLKESLDFAEKTIEQLKELLDNKTQELEKLDNIINALKSENDYLKENFTKVSENQVVDNKPDESIQNDKINMLIDRIEAMDEMLKARHDQVNTLDDELRKLVHSKQEDDKSKRQLALKLSKFVDKLEDMKK